MPTSVATREHEHSVGIPQNVSYPFWFGGSASCGAAVVTHPLDLGTSTFYLYGDFLSDHGLAAVKVRLQTRSSSHPAGMIATALSISRNDGLPGFYNGVWSLLSQNRLLKQSTHIVCPALSLVAAAGDILDDPVWRLRNYERIRFNNTFISGPCPLGIQFWFPGGDRW